MRRPAAEKGQKAAASPLGKRMTRARCFNLVAEPMEAPRTMLFICRTLLTMVITLVMVFAALEILTMDDATLVDLDVATTTDSWIATRNPWKADDDTAHSLVTTSEPNTQAATEFQLSLTLNVSIDKRDCMQVSLANHTGFFAA
eukprot:s894_g20.t1